MLILAFALAAQRQPVRPQSTPKRDVDDPGIIATGQRVTPAGIQTVFDGRVGGVRFGSGSDEIWVALPGTTYRLNWRDNSVVARGRVDGTPGVFAVSTDPLTHRLVVSSVGQLPTAKRAAGRGSRRPPDVSQLSIFDPNAIGDSVAPRFNSGPVGDYMAGAPAIAARVGPGGRRLAVLPLPANDALAVLDADSGSLIRTIPLGVEPISAVITPDGGTAYVSILGGPRPTGTQRSMRQCCDPRAEAVRIDARGIAEPGSVSRIDLATGAVVADIAVGRHPTAMVWDQPGGRLYVANGNSDSVTVIDTKSDNISAQIPIAPFRDRKTGLAPTALALSPDMHTLYVALGGANAVAVYDVTGPRAQFQGLIPAAWYPASLDVSSDGRYLAVGALLGIGSGTGRTSGMDGRYVHAVRGTVHVLPIPTAAQLTAFTTAVSENNHLRLASAPAGAVATRSQTPRVVPELPGDSSLIRHVVFIVRENRTYDQVLGDLDRGERDSTLVQYGKDVTPNTHALSRQFVTLDHFFASGGNSADGHQWLTQANETDYPMWPLYLGRSYPSEGDDALAYSSGGFLWEAAQEKGRTVTIFGEYAPPPAFASDTVRWRMLADYRDHPNDFAIQRAMLTTRFNTKSEIPSHDRALVREYPGWTQEVPDVVKAGDILWHLDAWESQHEMPNLTMIILPNDHTQGTSAGWCVPKACVADNDLALGKIVEGLSHSSFWTDMAIFVVEDDAQNGVDHIDGHRTVALAISPYARRGIVDSTFYSQPSMVKTIELMLGLPSMSIFDLVATDMRASFIDPLSPPNLTPYSALEPVQSLLERNPRPGGIRGANAAERRTAALNSERMDFRHPDEAPTEMLNRILWHDAKGWTVPYPAVKHSLFFPMSIDVADEDREMKPAGKKKP